MARIYTRTGDNGTTGMFGGSRVPKNSPLMSAVGTAQELSAMIGVAVESLSFLPVSPDSHIFRDLNRVQRELFEIGALIGGAEVPGGWPGAEWMEESIDLMTKAMPELKNFILPGGSEPGAALHLATAVARRFERSCLVLTEAPWFMSEDLLVWNNRVSDLLFTLARYVNDLCDSPEEIWKP